MNKKFEELVKEQIAIQDEIDNIFEDLQLSETAKDLWLLINRLIDNKIKQENFTEEE